MRRASDMMIRLLAVMVLAAYGWAIRHTSQGAADPAWQRIQAAGVLRVGTDPGFRPFAEQQDGRWQGYDVDLATEIARRLNLRPEFVSVSYDALYDNLAAGKVDLLAAALPLAPEQGWRARFTSAYLDAGQVLVTSTSSPIASETELGGLRVGAALGSEGDTILRRLAHQDATIQTHSEFDQPPDALGALAAGRLDAVITDAVSALSLTQRDQQFHIARGLTFDPYVLAAPIEGYQLQAAVNQTLDDLRREGFFDRLNAKWFGS